jgi:nucleoid DNA-binding protein
MKKLIFMTLFLTSCGIMAQTPVKMNNSGVYQAASKERSVSVGTDTGKKMNIKGKLYPIFKTARGKFYVLRVSKAGKEYKQYLKLE